MRQCKNCKTLSIRKLITQRHLFIFDRQSQPDKRLSEKQALSLNFDEILKDPLENANKYLGYNRSMGDPVVKEFCEILNGYKQLDLHERKSLADLESNTRKLPLELKSCFRQTKAPMLSVVPYKRQAKLHYALTHCLNYPKATTISDISEQLSKFHVTPLYETFSLLIRRFITFKYEKLALVTYNTVLRVFKKPSASVCTSLVSYYISKGKYVEFLEFLKEIQSSTGASVEKKIDNIAIFRLETIELFGAVMNAFIKFSKYEIADAYFEENSKIHGVDMKVLIMYLTNKTAQGDWRKGHQICKTIIRYCRENNLELEDWATFHIIVFLEKSGNIVEANVLRNMTGRNTFLGASCRELPKLSFRIKSRLFLPWHNQNKLLIQELPNNKSFSILQDKN